MICRVPRKQLSIEPSLLPCSSSVALSVSAPPPVLVGGRFGGANSSSAGLGGDDSELGADDCDRLSGAIPSGLDAQTWYTFACSRSAGSTFFRSASVTFSSDNYVQLILTSAPCLFTALPSTADGFTDQFPSLSSTSASLLDVQSTSATSTQSCVYVVCNNAVFACDSNGPVVLTTAYRRPPSSTSCTLSNVGLPGTTPGSWFSGGISCILSNIPSNYQQSVTIANPNLYALAVYVTDGIDCSTTASSFRFYAGTSRTTSSSISYSNQPCQRSPCCTRIQCVNEARNVPACIGVTIASTSFSTGSATATTALGVILGIVIPVIVIGILVGVCVHRRRKYYSDGSAGTTTVVVTNPAPYGGAPAVMESYPQAANPVPPQQGAYPQQPQFGGAPAYGMPPQPQFGSAPAYGMAPPQPYGAPAYGMPPQAPYGAPPLRT